MSQRTDRPGATPASPFATSPAGASRPLPRAVSSELLLQGERLVEILHNGEVYRLQATRTGKLILTK